MQITDNLKLTRDETLKYFDLDAGLTAKAYGTGKWTVHQILHHLADAESVLCERIKRGIAEPHSIVYLFDQDKWNSALRYPEMPLPLAKNIFLSVREEIIYLAMQFYESHGGNTFFQHQVGLRTVKDEFDKVVWHNEKHLVQIRQALQTA